MSTVLTYVGEEWAASRMAGTGSLNIAATHIGWGTGTGQAAKGDLWLGGTAVALVGDTTEVGTRGSAAVDITGSGTSAKFRALATLSNTSGSSYAITEAGLFSASTAGASMFVRGDFGVINLNDGDQITFTITIDPQ